MSFVDRASSVFGRGMSAARNLGARRRGPLTRTRPSGRLAVETLEDRMCPTTLMFALPHGAPMLPGFGNDIVAFIGGPVEFIDARDCVAPWDTALRPVQTMVIMDPGFINGNENGAQFSQVITLYQDGLPRTTAIPSGTRLANLSSEGLGTIGTRDFDRYSATVLEPSNLLAAAVGTGAGEAVTQNQVHSLLGEAVARWAATGVDARRLASMDVHVTDLPGAQLGMASGDTIWLDRDAAGWGWFNDPTPGDDSEFFLSGDQGEQNRMDLLTVIEHELGHVLGLEHDEEGVMAETLAAGTRLTPGHGTDADTSAPARDMLFAWFAANDDLPWNATSLGQRRTKR